MSYASYQQFNPPRWLGTESAPVGWEVRRLKFAVTCNDEALSETTDLDYEMAYVDISSVDLVNGIMTVETLSFEEAPSRARRIVRDGDTIISTVRTYLKAIAAIEEPPNNMVVSTGFAVVRPLGFIDSGFLGYALQGTGFIDAVVANSTGVSYPAINPTTLVCLPFGYPEDKKEQQQIAAFLDWKSGQIDALISRKKELLEKLKEKRIAVITQAVTQGLNPAAPMREAKRLHLTKFVLSCHPNPAAYLDSAGKYLQRDHSIRHYLYQDIDGLSLDALDNTNVEYIN